MTSSGRLPTAHAEGSIADVRSMCAGCETPVPLWQTDRVGDTEVPKVPAASTPPAPPVAPNPDQWLLLIYRVPSEPSRLRAAVWRRLKSLGAVYVQNSVAALPSGDAAERALRRLRREILEMEGTAVLMSCSALVGGQDVLALFQAARDSEYEEILDKCVDFHAGLEKEYAAEHFTYGELEENEVELVKLNNWYGKVLARDVFGASTRVSAHEALEGCAQALEAYAARVYLEEGDGA